MKTRVVLFIKWRSKKGVFQIFQYYVTEELRDLILSSEFSFVVKYLRSFSYGYTIFHRSVLAPCGLRSFYNRLYDLFHHNWHIVAFSIYKKSLL